MPCYKYDSNELQHGGGITTFVRAGEVMKHDAAIVLTVMKATTKSYRAAEEKKECCYRACSDSRTKNCGRAFCY